MEISITWNICRVCLVEEEKKPEMSAVIAEPMRHIFNDDKMLAQQIFECSGITIEPHDNLPEKICKKCYTSIKYAANFRKTCRASDSYLQNILQRTKSASVLFKKQQPPLQDHLEDIIISDDSSNSVNRSEGGTNSIKTFENLRKRKGFHLEKARKKIKGSDFSDLIELENVDTGSENDFKNRVAQHDIVEYSDSFIEVLSNVKHVDQVILKLNTSPKQELKKNEKKTGFLEENHICESEDLKNYKGDPLFTNSSEDEENVENYEQTVEFVSHKDINRCDTTSDRESDSEAKVSSTVAVQEIDNDLIEFKIEDTNLSSENNDMQTEYITDEYLIDSTSRDSASLKNPSVIVVHSKGAKSVSNEQQNDLSVTKTTGTNFQEWVCDVCGNHFVNRQLLNSHLKVHRQEKNHECEICLKRFITACNLQAHMRTHTGEKPFECKYCGRRFSDRSSNLRHERTHTNERPFECKECGKSFSLATTLKKHLTVHTGERSFSCNICAKAFKLPHQLKAHKNSTLHKAVEQLTQMNQ